MEKDALIKGLNIRREDLLREVNRLSRCFNSELGSKNYSRLAQVACELNSAVDRLKLIEDTIQDVSALRR